MFGLTLQVIDLCSDSTWLSVKMKRRREEKRRKNRGMMVGAKELRVKGNINRDCAAVILVANITKPQDICSCPN